MKNKEIKNLTPAMVEELRGLGVEFTNTLDCWVKCLEGKWHRMDFDSAQWHYESPDTIYTECQLAPNLQEVIDKLPKEIKDDDVYFQLCIKHDGDDFNIAYEGVLSVFADVWFANRNLLIAAFELLKWVATHHPNVLKEGNNE